MRFDPRARSAVTPANRALRPAQDREDELVIPQRRRGPLEWLRYRLARPARDAQEERDATDFLAAVKEADPPAYRIRQRDLPSANRLIPTMLLAGDVRQPWGMAPYAPDPEDESRELVRDGAQEEPQEGPEQAREEERKPLPDLRAWSPGDPGPTPTGVLQKITPEVERHLRPYLDALPRYEDEPGQ
jgi:hypothetical protein